MKKQVIYNVVDISRYVINYSNQKEYGITNLKLQKLLYFIQAYFVVSKKGVPCFSEKIEAWDFGAVVPESYKKFSCFGLSNIPEIKSYIIFPTENIWDFERVAYSDDFISKKDKKLINEVVDLMSEYSSNQLLNIIFDQEPFKKAHAQGGGTEITLKSLKEYFS